MKYYIMVLKKYAVFRGRSRRAEYWYFILINSIISFAIGMVFGSSYGDTSIVNYIYSLAVFIPGLAVTVRRMHDINKSGWWILINLIPLVGWIIFIVWAARDSQEGANKYGSNPKEVNGDPVEMSA
ncbi:MAG: uncharacterized membrane protein YhaH (DUF805 family) [Planctomycetota bacterium]|jgi:uncharacterized membrane protein YhaH (DUF805 family)